MTVITVRYLLHSCVLPSSTKSSSSSSVLFLLPIIVKRAVVAYLMMHLSFTFAFYLIVVWFGAVFAFLYIYRCRHH